MSDNTCTTKVDVNFARRGGRVFYSGETFVQALQVLADNAKDVCDWANSLTGGESPLRYDAEGRILVARDPQSTPLVLAEVGDWVVCNADGVFSGYTPEQLAAAYEPVLQLTALSLFRPLSAEELADEERHVLASPETREHCGRLVATIQHLRRTAGVLEPQEEVR